jgi:hypothetical protein
MGKLMTFVTILVMIDMMLLISGVVQDLTFNSALLNAVLDWRTTDVFSWQFFWGLIGDLTEAATSGSGILSLLLGAGIVAGFFIFPSDTKLFIPIAAFLALASQDFIVVGQQLAEINGILATLFIVPILILYILTILDWVRGRD